MTRLMAVILAVLAATATVLIVVVGVGLWQVFDGRTGGNQPLKIVPSECEAHVLVLRRDAEQPGSVTAEEKAAATEGRIRCIDAGIR